MVSKFQITHKNDLIRTTRIRSFLFKPKGLVCNRGLPCMSFRLDYIQLKLITFRYFEFHTPPQR